MLCYFRTEPPLSEAKWAGIHFSVSLSPIRYMRYELQTSSRDFTVILLKTDKFL